MNEVSQVDIWEITESEIEEVERLLLPDGCHFSDDAKTVIRFWNSTDVSACPGSGKTTVLLAKLKLIADRMPLEKGAGICVLSHTNVAVNEIKSKLAVYTDKLMSYPNYVGTIQTFIDRFVTFPYLRTLTTEPIQVVDDKTYAQHLWHLISSNRASYGTLIAVIEKRAALLKSRYPDRISYMAGIFLDDGALMHEAQPARALAGAESASAKQYADVQDKLLKEEGILTYDHAYHYASQAISNRPELTNLLSRRFRFAFVDEYQDCSELQRRILECIFDRSQCSVFLIGDPDQAIYNSDKHNPEDWKPAENALPIASSNRYPQEIADILTPLRTGKLQITSQLGTYGRAPTIIIFDDSTRKKVIEAFISLLDKYSLTDPDGIYKVVGWIKTETSKGLKIGDYWDEFSANASALSETKYWSMIDVLCNELTAGKLYRAENIARRLLCRILHYLKCQDGNGRTYTFNSIKKILDDKYFDYYREGILALSQLDSISREAVDQAVRNLVNGFGSRVGTSVDVFPRLPDHFMEEDMRAKTKPDSRNVLIDPIRGRLIQFSTVHKVKGETHDATLYLETVNNRKSDLQRVIPYFTGTTPGSGQIDNYSRKIVYVGLSRPRRLLCVAMSAETYEAGKKGFANWEVYDCRKIRQ